MNNINIRYMELRPGTKEPAHDFETFSTDHKNYNDAGIILNKDILVVDFDDYTDVGELIYNGSPTLRVNTRRGFHLWYKKPNVDNIKTPFRNYVDKLVVAGIKVDFKTGVKSFATIKQNGKMREMENEHYLDDLNTLPELPFALLPSKLKHDIYDLDDGQGRNAAMYSHLLSTAEQYPMADDDMNNLADFINKNVFKKPLDKEELANTIQSVKNKKPAPGNQKYLDAKDIVMTSEVLVEKLDMQYYRNKIYFKNDNHYISDSNLMLRAIDKLIALKPNQHKQLLELFKIKATLQNNDEFPVQFNNGYVLYDDEIIEVDPGFTPYFVDVAYKEDAYDKHVDEFLDWFTVGKKDLRLVIEEMFGHMLMTRGFPHKSFFLWGETGSNGKSTIIKMLKSFSEGLNTSVPLDKFEDDTSVFSLIGTLVNVADDIDASYMERSSNFKTIAAGDPVMIRPIYEQPTTFFNTATLIFTCNELPVFKDKTGGIKRRMQVIPCEAELTQRNPEIDDLLSSDNAKSYILNLALAGVDRIIKNGGLSESETITEATKHYFVQTDSVVGFLNETSILGATTTNAYVMYKAHCEIYGLNAVGNTEFGRRVKSAGYESNQKWLDGKNRRVYVKS